MTCIAAVANGRKVWIGGDSAGTDGMLNRYIISSPKVFALDGLVMGFAGSFKSLQVTQSKLNVPTRPANMSDYTFMTSDFIDAFSANLINNGGEGDESMWNGECLVGYRGKVYEIQSNYQVLDARCGYAAIGSGGRHAIGSLHGSEGKPEARVRKALQAAASHNAGVAEPFVIISGGAK